MGATAPSIPSGRRHRNPFVVALLTLVTLGVYGFVWWFRVFKEVDEHEGEAHNKALFVAGLLTVPFLPIGLIPMAVYGWMEMRNLHRAKLHRNLQPGVSGGDWYEILGAAAGVVLAGLWLGIVLGVAFVLQILVPGGVDAESMPLVVLGAAGALVVVLAPFVLVQSEVNKFWAATPQPMVVRARPAPGAHLEAHAKPVKKSSPSWGAYKAAWRVIRTDPELLWSPVLALILLAILLPVCVAAWIGGVEVVGRFNVPVAVLFVLTVPFVWLWVTTLVLVDAFIIVTAHERLQGGSPTLGSSLAKVGKRLPSLLAWSFLVSFVYSVIALVSRRGGAGRWVAGAGGVAVSLATFFVVPHLVLEGGPVRGAVKRSGQTVFNRFGAVTGRTVAFGIYAAVPFFLLFLGGPMVMGSVVNGIARSMSDPPDALAALIFLPWALALLWALGNAIASSVYKVALYDSVRGLRVSWFPKEALLEPFR